MPTPRDLLGACVVFDLDGTLVDTAPDLLRALDRTLIEADLPQPPPETVRAFVGHGARALIERAAAHMGATLAPERLPDLVERFVAHYRADIAAESRPFQGAVAALDQLAEAGAILAICTNKRTDLSVQLLDALGLSPRFAAIVGADAVSERKPSPVHYVETVARAGGALDRSVMIGDTDADVRAAKAAGRPAIAVAFGYGPTPAHELGADAVIAGYDELSSAVRKALAA